MTLTKLKKLLKDPTLLTTLSCMIASTLISFFLVSKNNFKIDMLESEIRDQKIILSDTKNQVNQKRIQVDSVILLNAVMDKKSKKNKNLKERYLHSFSNLNANSSGIEILLEFEKYRNLKFNKINDIYIKQIALEEKKDLLGRKNKIYGSIATLLQVLGLALIIIRKDLSLDSFY